MEHEEIYTTCCPKYNVKVTHTVILKDRTCSRIDDSVVYFSCSKDPSCKECQKDYP